MDEYAFWLFDLDGTLVDVEWSYKSMILDGISDELGWTLTRDEKLCFWHGDGGIRHSLLDEYNIGVEEFWELFDEIDDPRERAESTYLYDDVVRIAELDEPVGLVTHCPREKANIVLDHLDIGDWFDTIICCSDDLGWKPDPAPVQHAMADLGVGHNGHVGVLAGDGPHDIGAAWNAGLDAIHVERHDPHRREQCILGDYRVESFEELWSESRHPVEGSD